MVETMVNMIMNSAAICICILMYGLVGFVTVNLIRKVINDIVRNVTELRMDMRDRKELRDNRYNAS